MTGKEELALVERAKKGKRDAFEALVRAYERPMYNYALRLLRNPDDAADAVQEAFLKAYTGLNTFRGNSKFSVWLYRILNNTCIDLIRKRRETVSLSGENGEAEEIIDIPDDRFDPAAVLETRDLREQVRKGLALLPEDFRKPLLLREYGEFSYAEIAEILSLDEGTVKTRIFRARKKLCAILSKGGNFPGGNPSKDTKGGGRT